MKSIIPFIAVLFVSQFSQASFFEKCDIQGEVQSLGDISSPTKGISKYNREIILDIQVAEGSSTCDYYLGKLKAFKVQSAALMDLSLLKVGSVQKITYYNSNALTPEGPISSDSAVSKTEAEDVLFAVYQDSSVDMLIEELRAELAVLDGEYVQTLKQTVETLPEGICGIFGCDKTFLVSITLGQDYRNSLRKTVVVKVYKNALNEISGVQILSSEN